MYEAPKGKEERSLSLCISTGSTERGHNEVAVFDLDGFVVGSGQEVRNAVRESPSPSLFEEVRL
jgi:hypothetical protein